MLRAPTLMPMVLLPEAGLRLPPMSSKYWLSETSRKSIVLRQRLPSQAWCSTSNRWRESLKTLSLGKYSAPTSPRVLRVR